MRPARRAGPTGSNPPRRRPTIASPQTDASILELDQPPEIEPTLRCLSLGWGVQSFTLAVMSALGELPKLDAAIHADTGHENPLTYLHARKWTPWLEDHGLPVITVKPQNNSPVRTDWGRGSVQIPAFTQSRNDKKTGQVKRQCTRHWKITPIRTALRALAGRQRLPPGYVEQWQGISLDEWHRMRTSDVKYIRNHYPLVQMRMSRNDCTYWLEQHQIAIPPKSACTFCPYQSRDHWRQMKRAGGPAWQEIVSTDQQIRQAERANVLYVHSSRLPVEEAVNIPEDEGASQLTFEVPCDGGTCFV